MVEKNTVRQGYDELADVHASQRTDSGLGMELLDRLLDALPETALVLDAGCGQGDPVLARVSESARSVGVDFSGEQLRLASESAPGSALVQGDMTTLPFAAAEFDAVVAYWSLIHVPLDSHRSVLEEFARVLRPDGQLLLCEGTNEWTGENTNWLDSGVEMQWEIAGAETTREQLDAAGFSIVDSWGALSELRGDRDVENEDDSPWTFFAARLDGAD